MKKLPKKVIFIFYYLEIHDEGILKLILSKNQNLMYTIDKNGIVKISEIVDTINRKQNVLNVKQTINLNENNISKSKFLFDVELIKDKYLIFNKNTKIKLYDIKKNAKNTIGLHTSALKFLNFSSDGKYIISAGTADYFLSLWGVYNNKETKSLNSPLATLELDNSVNSFNKIKLLNKDKDIYHALVMNKENICIYPINVNSINSAPIKPSVIIDFSEKNLLEIDCGTDTNTNREQNIFAVYGNEVHIDNRSIKYAKNANSFNTDKITINKNTKKGSDSDKKANDINTHTVLNEIDMNNAHELNSVQTNNKIIHDSNEAASSSVILTTTENKISLVNIIRNSIINNDSNSFDWALDQKDINTIDNTVINMDKDLVGSFIAKFVEGFQSSNFYKKNLIPWLDSLFKHHFALLVVMPKYSLDSLKNLKTMIENRTKNLNRLVEVHSKLENLIEIFDKNNKVNGETNHTINKEPLLVYNESDSEEEVIKKNLTEKLNARGMIRTNEKAFKEKQATENEMDVDENGEEADDIYDAEDDIDAELADEEELNQENDENDEEEVEEDDE